jgi:hypothetical protein
MTRIRQAILALAFCTLAAQAQPKGRRPADASLTQAIHKALPAGATEVNKPLAIVFPPLGKIHVVLYRRSPEDRQVRSLVLLPSYKAAPLPETSSSEEEIATAVFSAHVAPKARALIVLFYTHAAGKPGSEAHGRAYIYRSGAFQLDPEASKKLEGVRTAAVARLKLAE